MTRPFANFIGIDDGPFDPSHRGDVALVGAVYTKQRLEGIVTGKARKDGANGTRQIAAMIRGARYNPKVVLLGGIAVGGFNVVDIHALHEDLGLPVLVVARRRPNLRRIERALLENVPGGARKWRLIQKAGPMEPLEGVWVQRAGLDAHRAAQVLRATTEHGKIPEPLRVAHLIAGGLVRGHSRGRA
jgi:endonuclease V-like protein UPF0215 family